MKITKLSLRLFSSAKAVVALLLKLPGTDRVGHVIQRLEKYSGPEVAECMKNIMWEYGDRHRNIDRIFQNHFQQTAIQFGKDLSHFASQKQLLMGAFFTKEYSIESAALFNPSIVPHPEQGGLNTDEQRFIMSLRATGEGHISSIVFRSGVVNLQGNITLDKHGRYSTCLRKKTDALYEKILIKKYAETLPLFSMAFLEKLPDTFTEAHIKNILSTGLYQDQSLAETVRLLEEWMDMNYELENSSDIPINEKVIFPSGKGESMGMEDVRLVKFKDGGQTRYYGTYTAYNGKQIRTQLIETTDFNSFKIRTLNGPAIQDKGMALLPEKVNGKYVMISRQGGENINIMFSDDLYYWKEFHLLMEPRFTWELVQLGNCGSPIHTEKGWLLLTHGVGPMRKYVISAILLDLQNPALIVGRLDKPFIEADELEREGYVPNVVYTCGFMRHGNLLIIPYAVSDSATGFIHISLDDLLNEFTL